MPHNIGVNMRKAISSSIGGGERTPRKSDKTGEAQRINKILKKEEDIWRRGDIF